MALEETADAVAALETAHIRVSRLIVNRVTAPPRQRCDWCEARRRFESRALAPVSRRFSDLDVVTYPEAEQEPRGVRALRALGKRQDRWQPPQISPPIEHRVRAEILPAEAGSSDRSTFIDGRDEPGAPGFSREKHTLPIPPDLQWLLFGGKGGVGKSTCAAAVALQMARTRRVLLLSTDPAHSLGDVFGERFDNTPRAVAGAPTLHVREIDAAAEMDAMRRRYLDAVDEAFARISRGSGGDAAAFRDLIDLAPPGIDEVIAIADVAEAIAGGKGGYDAVVTDTAPTGHALRLLQTPSLLREWTQALMALLLKYREVVGAGSLAALLVQLSKRLRGLQAILTDPGRTRLFVVTRPAMLPTAESRELVAALDRLGIAVGGIIVNAAGRGTCRRCRAIARAQAAEIGRLPRKHAIIEAPAEVPPPHGSAALRAWSTSWRQLRS
jgi:arsenite-transporting ATPase